MLLTPLNSYNSLLWEILVNGNTLNKCFIYYFDSASRNSSGSFFSVYELLFMFQGTSRLPSGLLIYWKNSQNSENLLYSWLQFITVKGYRLKSAKGKRHIGPGPGETRHKLPVVLSQWSWMDRTYFSQQWCIATCTEYCQPGKGS